MMALEEEKKLPFIRGEGPVGIIVCPSRELANQTYENVQTWCSALATDSKYAQLNTLLCIGGISMNEQSHIVSKGLHIVVATPGRLIDMLEKKRFTFNNCKFLCMDEADRMIDLGFEDDVRNIMSFFKVSNIIFELLYISSLFSINDRHCYSRPPCPRRFKTSLENLSLSQYWSMLGELVQLTWTYCKWSSMSSKKQKWCIFWNVCRKPRRLLSYSARIRTKLMV